MAPPLARHDWLEQGLQAVGDGGPQQLKIDALCTALGVTKGSFYHHFASQAAYVSALLLHWKNTYTEQLIEAVAGIDDPRARSERLSQLVFSKNMRPEVALRAWGNSHPEVAATVQVVDAQRINYLTNLAQRMGLDTPKARLMARMGYAQLIGIQHLPTLVTPEDAMQMDHCLSTVVFSALGGWVLGDVGVLCLGELFWVLSG